MSKTGHINKEPQKPYIAIKQHIKHLWHVHWLLLVKIIKEMDRAISQNTKTKKRQKLIIKVSIWIAGIVLANILLSAAIRPSIEKDEFFTDTVSTGNIEASIMATGKVIPEFEELKTSPVQSQIATIYKNTGDKVSPGDTILSLNKDETMLNLTKLQDELEMKKNNVERLKLKLEKNLIDLKTNYNIKELQVKNQEANLEEEKYLHSIGGGTKEKIKKAELNLSISKMQLEQLKQNIRNLEQSIKAELTGLSLEIKIQEKNVNELQNKLKKSTIVSDKKGVITWINDKIGKTVYLGGELVRIADLNSYEIESKIADRHASKLNIGDSVIIRINDKNNLRGEIINISPGVNDNTIAFKVKLINNKHELLRPNLKVDVYVVTSYVQEVLTIRNGSFYNGAHRQDVFVLKGDRLVKKEVFFGESNFDLVEVTSGLQKGDIVVISDMRSYEKKDKLKIKN